VAARFPDECRYVLETFREVYKNDALAQGQGMSAEERLAFHKAESGPLMERFNHWLHEQIDEKKVEPNSGLGEAIKYTIKHWEPLTLFLRVAGAPLDNNACERILKKAILHRKASLFYKTENGAHVGDLFMSLIHTCELCQADPFDYLTDLQRNAKEVAANPQNWLPWNYRESLLYSASPHRAPP
jgi:transposase